MLTKTTLISLLLVLPVLLLLQRGDGATTTWGHVNKYASTLHAQDVYLGHVSSMDADANADADATAVSVDVRDVAYGAQNSSAVDGYTITAVHAYDMTLPGGNGGQVRLLSGGVGQRHAVVRFQRYEQVPRAHFQLVIYGLALG
ncbi:PREDICTED: uncharacterized protein LOC108617329 [Drosophila arizonae]|uniref:Uncharacterized protein LOC108617329 n=1 Tax=Drosophila arizonae TaxID=7263 RepID=A0ABM1PN04_DROAR|nr:PREDICTED: uncharacterized protein LOC108617329 [Drosophila arizonae]XP_017868591.1 PREDICTED: uncharacterized protein LOC108617329 [Drosophila arizonae]